MLYKVEAKFDKANLDVFFADLTNGTIGNQEPDGSTIVKAMKEAVMLGENKLAWYEKCLCATPLKHERETVYDKYFFDFKTTLVQRVEDDIVGDSFWEYLAAL